MCTFARDTGVGAAGRSPHRGSGPRGAGCPGVGPATSPMATRLMAYGAVDEYVAERVGHFLRRRHKVPARGTRRLAAEVVFGDLGVFQLRCFHLGSPVHAVV